MAAKKCLICNCAFSGRADARTCSPRCRKRLQQVRSELGAPVKRRFAKAAVLLVLGLFGFLSILFSTLGPKAQAATSSNLNFQARLLNSAGGIVPDGTYNIDFKIYNADSTTGTVGTCTGACLWEETRKNFNSQGVQVINGYFSVNLGSVTSFPSINWDQQLWLTMNIGGTSAGASPTWDGEMQNASHSIALTALPYAFVAGQVSKTSGANRGTLSFNTVANNPNITIPDVASGTLCIQTSTACGFELTTGTDFIQNQAATPQSANFNIQSAASGSIAALITGASGQSVDILDVKANAITNPLFSVGSTGAAKFQNSSNSTAAFQIQNASNTVLLNADSVNSTISLGNNGAPYALSLPGSSGAYASTPDSVANSVTGDLDLRVRVAPTTWSTGVVQQLISKWNTTGNQRSFWFVLGTTGHPQFQYSPDGTTIRTDPGGSALPFANGQAAWVRVTYASATGVVSYYYANDSPYMPTTWTAAGGSTITSGSIFDSTAAVEVGSNSGGTTALLAGTVYRAQVYAGINGTLKNDFDPTLAAATSSTTLTAATGETWTRNGTASFLANSSATFAGSQISLNNATLVRNTSDSTTAFQVLNAAGASSVLDVDTVNGRVGIGTNAPAQALDVNGSARASLFRSNSGIVNDSSSNNARVTTATTGTVIDRNVADANVALTVTQLNASSTGDILDLKNSSATVASVSQAGAVVFENSANSAAAFQVQNLSGSDLLNVNTTDGYVINNGTEGLDNQIQNAGFESSGTTDSTGWYTPSATQVITNSSANAHTGNYELQVTGNSATHAVTTKWYAVHPSDTIYTEAWVKNSAGATGDAGIYLEFADKDKGNSTFSNADTGLPGTSYIVKSITAAVPSGKAYVRVVASVKSTATTGTFYFDDFYMKRANQQAPLNITNVSTTAFQVQNSSAVTVLGVDSTNSKIFSGIADGGTAVGFTLNTTNTYSTAGAKLISLQNNGAEKLSVSKDGDLTASGNISIATGKTYQINGTQISSTALSNDSDIAKLSGTGPQTFSGNNKFTGTILSQTTSTTAFQVQNATNSVFLVDTSGNKTVLGTGGASGLTANLQFNFSGSTGSTSLVPLDPSSTAYTLNLPAESGILCSSAASSTANCTNFASSSSVTTGLAGKLNKSAVDTSSAAVTAVQGNLYAFTNSSSNIASGVLKLDNGNNTNNALLVTGTTDYASGKAYIVVNNTNGTPTGNLIDLQSNATDEFTVDASGNVFANGNINIATGKQYQINGTQISSTALSDGANLAKLNGTQTFTGANTFSNASNSFTGDGSGLTNLNATNIASGTLNDGRLSSNVALLNRTGQSFTGDNTFAPTANGAGTTIKQTSGTATSGNVLDVQTQNGTSHFLQITNAAANEGNVTLQSVGATRDLTLNSGSGTIKIPSSTTTIQNTGSTSFTIDVQNGSNSTLFITNSSTGVASLDVEGGLNIGASQTYKVNGTQISSANLSNDSDIAKLSGTGPQTFTGNNKFTGTVLLKSSSASGFQIQPTATSTNLFAVDTAALTVSVGAPTIFNAGTFSSGSSATITQSLFDNNTTVQAQATTSGLTFSMPATLSVPTLGRLAYVTNTGANSFILNYGTGSFSLAVNKTMTLLWNGSNWTGAGTDNGTLQDAYNNSTGSTTPEIKLDPTRSGVDIQDADTTLGSGVSLFTVRGSNGSGLGNSLFNILANGKVGINIGSSSTTPTVSNDLSFGQIAGVTTARTIGVEAQGTTNIGGNGLTVAAGTGNGTAAGGILLLQGGTGGAGAAAAGGIVDVFGGNAAGTGASNGGNVVISGGTKSGSGAGGSVIIKPQTGNDTTTAFQIQNAAGTSNTLVVDTTGSTAIGVGMLPTHNEILQVGAAGVGVYNGATHIASITSNVGLQVITTGTSAWSNLGTDSGSTNILNLYNSSNAVVGSISGTGAAKFQNSTNSTTAFQVQNAAGTQLLNVDTSTTPNLLTNGSIEQAISGNWTQKVGGTPTQDATQKYLGNDSLKDITTAATDTGVFQSVTLGNSTTYSLSFEALLDGSSASFATLAAGYSSTGLTAGDTNCSLNSTNVLTTGWTRYICTFTTPSSHSGTPYIYIKQTDAAIHTFYIDAVQLETGSVAGGYQDGVISLNGVVGSPTVFENLVDSTSAFAVQNAAGNNIIAVDTLNKQLVLGSGDGATPAAMTIRGAAGAGSNIIGGDLIFDASNGTGAGGSGAFVFRTASGVNGTPIQQDTPHAASGTAVSSLTFNQTIPNGHTNVILLVAVDTTKSTAYATATSVTFNGTNLTQLTSSNGPNTTNRTHTELWYLKNPTTGSSLPVVANFSASTDASIGSVALWNVDLTNTFGTPVTTSGTGTAISVTVPGTTANQLVVDVSGNEGNSKSPAAGQSSLWNVSSNLDSLGGSSMTGVLGGTTMSWTITGGSVNWADLGVAINPVGGVSTDALTERLRIDQNGSATFQAANNTTAFQVKNASGTSLFGINSTNSQATINAGTIFASNTYSSGSSTTITPATVNANTTVLAAATATNLTFTMPSPTPSTAGRLVYVSNNGANAFTISYGTGSFVLNVNSTVTLVWNGTAWTNGGADSGNLQTVYNNSTGGSTPEIKVDSATHGAVNIQDADSPIGADLFEINASNASGIGTVLFGVGNTGNAIHRTTTDSTTAFQLQNSNGASMLTLDDTNSASGNNLAANSGAENTFGTEWAAVGTSTVTRDTTATEFISGLASAKAATTATNSGLKNVLSSTLSQSTTYLISFSIRGTVAGSDLTAEIRYNGTNIDAGTGAFNGCSNTMPITTTFTKVSCYFTTGSTNTFTSSNAVAIYETGTTKTFFVDNLSVIKQVTTSTATVSQLKVGGASGQGLVLLTADSFAGRPTTSSTPNTALYGSMYYDTTLGKMQCYEAAGWGYCGAAPDVSVNLVPEYTGAVLDASLIGSSNSIGTMTSGICSSSSRLSINTSVCNNTTDDYNYYSWNTIQPTTQSYSIYVRYQLPASFKSISSAGITVAGKSTDISAAVGGSGITDGVRMTMYDASNTTCFSNQAITTSSGAWVSTSLTSFGSCNFTANSIVMFKIDMTATNGGTAYVSNISFIAKGQ